jgi:hypothetical protein
VPDVSGRQRQLRKACGEPPPVSGDATPLSVDHVFTIMPECGLQLAALARDAVRELASPHQWDEKYFHFRSAAIYPHPDVDMICKSLPSDVCGPSLEVSSGVVLFIIFLVNETLRPF